MLDTHDTGTWHTEIRIGGELYPTRHYAPTVNGSMAKDFDLPPHQMDNLNSIHEAGHAVATLIGRWHLDFVRIAGDVTEPGPGGITNCISLPPGDGRTLAVFMAAGERAVDRWLHEQGLWTPERAVAAEISARADRQCLLAQNPHVGFGTGEIDYRVVHDLADEALDQHWPAVTATADALIRHQHLTGDQVARITGLPNQPRP